MSWLVLLRLVRSIGVDVVLPLIRAIYGLRQADAEQHLRDALTAQGAGRAANEASAATNRSTP